jgi:hypothetical protein
MGIENEKRRFGVGMGAFSIEIMIGNRGIMKERNCEEFMRD